MLIVCQRSRSNDDNHPVIVMPPRVWLQELLSFTYSKDSSQEMDGSLDGKVVIQHFQKNSLCKNSIYQNPTLELLLPSLFLGQRVFSDHFQCLNLSK